MPDHRNDTTEEPIACANRQIRDRQRASLGRRRQDARTRRLRAVMDDVVAVLEQRNLIGDRSMDSVVRKWLGLLETETGVPLPPQALRARNTARLHSVLLDWMDTVLDRLIPEGRHFPEDLEFD